jgi:hypothetical protein
VPVQATITPHAPFRSGARQLSIREPRRPTLCRTSTHTSHVVFHSLDATLRYLVALHAREYVRVETGFLTAKPLDTGSRG